jgi:predicted DNA-binding protein
MATERSAGTKNIMLRLDPELAERVQAVADVEGRSVSDVLREAVARLVEQRRKDKHFIRLLEENIARHQRLLKALRDEDGGLVT